MGFKECRWFAWEQSGTGERLIPGMEGVVTGGDSTKLGKKMMESMGLPRGTNWTGHQAQHIIPVEMADHPVLQRNGMDLDDASNGLFLRTPADDISAMVWFATKSKIFTAAWIAWIAIIS